MTDAENGDKKDPEATDKAEKAPETPQASPASPEKAPESFKVEEDKGGHGILYGLDSKPPLPKATVLALQHVLTMFGATVAVPLLLGPAMQMSPQNIAILISSVMLCSGLATLCQVTIGTKLPIIQGVSFSFLAPFFAIIGFVASEVSKGAVAPEMQGPVTMQYIAGSVLVGSVFEIIIGYTGLIGLLKKYLTPVVIGPVIMLIGLSLFQHGAPKAGADVFVSGLTIIAIIVFSLVLSRKHQFFRLFPILLSVILAWTLCTVLSAAKVFEPDTVLVSTKDMGLSPEAEGNAKLLAERYLAVNKAEVLALQGKAQAKSTKLGAEITSLYKKIRNTEGTNEKKELKTQIDKLVTEKNTEDTQLKALNGMLGKVYKSFCIVTKGNEQGLKTVALKDCGIAPLWKTDLTKEMTLVNMTGSGSTLAVGHPSYVYLDKVSDSPMFRDPTTLVFPWGWPAFNLGFIIAVLFA
ncbi:MAG: solute carrier family 23 protein, partial [Planctomycetota bacterium]|nr:solute carrier family 23 protein [Planctomycetota bacterium]